MGGKEGGGGQRGRVWRVKRGEALHTFFLFFVALTPDM